MSDVPFSFIPVWFVSSPIRFPRISWMLSPSRIVMPGLTFASASSEVGSICLLLR